MTWLWLDVHGRVAVRIAADAPGARQLRDMFAPFLAGALERVDLAVDARLRAVEGEADADGDYRYTETALTFAQPPLQVAREQGGWRLSGTGELLVHALPLVDRIAVTRGAAMIHAATVEHQGQGVIVAASGGAGKTSTIHRLLQQEGWSLMGDDWAFASEEGELLGYAKPMFIRPHHKAMFPHLFSGARRKRLLPPRFQAALGRAATAAHPVISRHPGLARAARRLSPEHMMVSPAQAFPGTPISTSARLGAAVFLERADVPRALLSEKETRWMASRLVGNFHAELPKASRELITALGATGLVPLEQAFAEKAEVLSSALAGRPCFLLQVPQGLTAGPAADQIVEQVNGILELTKVRG